MNSLATIRANIIKSQESVKTQLDAHVVAVAERKVEELRSGIGGDGNPISPEYSDSYYLEKRENPLYNTVGGATPDLHVSGNFHRSIWAKRNDYEYEFRLNNKKDYYDYLIDKYGEPADISPKGMIYLGNLIASNIRKDLIKIW